MSRSFFFLCVFSTFLQLAKSFSRHPAITTVGKESLRYRTTSLLDAESNVVNTGPAQPLLDIVGRLTASKLYSGIETVIVLGLLSAIDGGFSGDWSRLGIVSSEVETTLRSAVTSVGLFHLVCAPIAALSASKNKQPVAPAVLHTLLIGGLGLGKVLFQKEENLLKPPNIKQAFADAVAGKYDEVAVNQSIDDVIDQNAVVMFSFSSCPYCVKAKQLLIEELGVNVKVVELDTDRRVGFPIRAELGKRTGRVTVPSIWIGGQFIGGCNDGPTTVTQPAVKAVSKGINFLGFGDKTEAVASSDARVISTRGGVVSLNNEGVLETLLASAKAI